MKHEIFGELVFNTGWKSKKTLNMFNNNYSVNLKLQAYYEEDGIAQEQEQAYKEYQELRKNKQWVKPNINKWDYIKLTKLLHSEGTINKV